MVNIKVKEFFIVVLLIICKPISSQEVINEQNYIEKFQKFHVGDIDNYRASIKDFEECKWDDLTFLDKYGNKKTGAPLYGMGNFGWGDEIIAKSPQVRELGVTCVRSLFAEDDVFEKTAKAGINCVLFLGGTYYKDGDIEGWKKNVERSVRRYGKNGTFWREHPDLEPNPVRYYEILGETNIDSYVPPLGVDPVEHYFLYLKTAYGVIKSWDPDAYVVAFGTAGGNVGTWLGISYYSRFEKEYTAGEKMTYYGWLRFIEGVNLLGGHKYYDAIGLDNYSQPYGPDYKGNVVKALLLLREEMKKYGAEQKPIWFTEVGYPMRYRNNKYEYDDQKQADFTLRLYGLAASHGVERIQSFHVVDFSQGSEDASMVRKFGFFDDQGKVRKQGLALKTMIELMPEPKLMETISDGKDDFYSYVFKGVNKTKVIMLWLANEETYLDNETRIYKKPEIKTQRTIKIADNSAILVDMYGNKKPLSVVSGNIIVEVSPSPVFVVTQ